MTTTLTKNWHQNLQSKRLFLNALLFTFSIFLLSIDSIAQTFPPATSCTSKDLELISATLPVPPGLDPCTCNGTRQLILGIRNKTGSFRTSFALWGTLRRYDATGKQIGTGTPIFACASGVDANKDNFLPATSGTTTITVSCGESLEITDLFLAWTTANTKETCDYLSKNSATINPKCGTVPSIKIGLGVSGDFEVNNATCQSNGTSTGTLKVSPNGGVGPYKVKIGTDERTNIAAGSSTTFTLAPNTYSILITDSRGCNTTFSRTIDAPPSVSVSGIGGAFTKTCTQNTSGGIIGETPVNGFSYSWSPSTGLSSTSIGNPTANPAATTTYTVTKTNTSTGCSAQASVTVSVDNTPVSVSSIGGAFTKTCISNTSGNTIGETAQAGYTYSWSSSPAGFSSALANPTVNPAATTTYTVRKTKTSSGCFEEAAVTVTVNNTPVTVSAGSAFTKSCTSNVNGAIIGETPVSGFSYSWSPATGLSDDKIGNPTANPTVTTTYTVTKTDNSTGCSKQASVTVTIDNTPISVSAGNNFTKTCSQNTSGATIGETPVNGYTYSWSPTTGLSNASIGNPTANPTTTTTYIVTKTNTSSGCTNTASVTVTVDNTPVSVSGIGGAFTKTCITNTSGNTIGETPVNGFSYSWSPATGLSNDKIGNPTANPSATTTYTVTKTNTTTGCFQQATVTVTVNNTVPTFTVCLVQPTLCANSGSVTFTANGGSGFEYSINNGTHYQAGNSFTGLSSGSVTGFLVKNSFGCVSAATNCNTTSQCESLLSNPTTASPQPTEIQEQGLKVKAFPNPFNNRIRFEVNASEAGNGSLEVYNTLGQKIKTVYRGFLKSGIQTFEWNVPANQHSTLIYIFKMGSKQVTGKLVSAGN